MHDQAINGKQSRAAIYCQTGSLAQPKAHDSDMLSNLRAQMASCLQQCSSSSLKLQLWMDLNRSRDSTARCFWGNAKPEQQLDKLYRWEPSLKSVVYVLYAQVSGSSALLAAVQLQLSFQLKTEGQCPVVTGIHYPVWLKVTFGVCSSSLGALKHHMPMLGAQHRPDTGTLLILLVLHMLVLVPDPA